MSLVDKFSAIEIKADNRISKEDKEFCQCHQEAFDKSGPALQRIADAIIAGNEEQKSILRTEHENQIFYNPYMTGSRFECEVDQVYCVMEERNRKFISRIVNYFSRKYNVKLDESEIIKHLILAAPKEPELPWDGYRNMSSEEMNAFKKKIAAYKADEASYHTALRSLPLRYEQIVDEIFVQLGGFSLEERAMNEMLSRCWKASHHEDWRTEKMEERFEVKNATLKLLEEGYWCRYNSKWESNQDLRVILDALAHFQCGRMNEGHLWFPELFKYEISENTFDIYNMGKIKNIKLFKNGRVDIKFSSAAYAQEFVENYLRKYVEVDVT